MTTVTTRSLFAPAAIEPVTFKTEYEAKDNLIPNLAVASDHYPVAVDFEYENTLH